MSNEERKWAKNPELDIKDNDVKEEQMEFVFDDESDLLEKLKSLNEQKLKHPEDVA